MHDAFALGDRPSHFLEGSFRYADEPRRRWTDEDRARIPQRWRSRARLSREWRASVCSSLAYGMEPRASGGSEGIGVCGRARRGGGQCCLLPRNLVNALKGRHFFAFTLRACCSYADSERGIPKWRIFDADWTEAGGTRRNPILRICAIGFRATLRRGPHGQLDTSRICRRSVNAEIVRDSRVATSKESAFVLDERRGEMG
jgi:hypothetical protein